ncbi:MarR family transcriptional regulator [soil metagenome]
MADRTSTEKDAPLDLAARMRATVVPLARALRQQSGGQLTATQVSVLGSIVRHGPIGLTALAAREQLSLPMVSKVVGILEDNELVERAPDPADARVSLVSVARQGRAWVNESRRRRDEWLAERLAELTADERAVVDTAIAALDRVLTDP